MSFSRIQPAELDALRTRNEPVDLIDVRTPVEFREVHVGYARNVPLHVLDPQAVMAARNGDRDKPLYLVCKGGSRSRQACEKFVAAGFANVVDVEGGTQACVEAGLPVVRGKKALPLERQVPLASGLVIVAGTLLGVLVNPWFLVVPAGAGAGLAVAGLTGWCGMAMLLARMPWNQVGGEARSCCPN